MTGAVAVPYIGRTDHRAAVAAAFAEPGHVLLICGEAGVGKSSLIAAERADATTDVVEGSCLQLAGQPLALAALEMIFDARGGWPESADGAEQQSPEQRLRAIRRWADALAPVGTATPTTLVVEDLQWADETTCDFLVYLASTAARRRLSLVITLRDDETPRVGRVQQACADLARLPGARNIQLQRLGLEEARELVALLTGSTEVDVDAWFEQSQGNPYLLGELVRDPGARRVKDVLLARVNALGPDAAELVRLAAVFGLWVADADLHAASVLPPDRYARAVREAVDVGVLVVEGRRLRLPAQPDVRGGARPAAADRAADPARAGGPGAGRPDGGRRRDGDRRERALGGRRGARPGGRVVPARRAQGPVAQRVRRVVGPLPARPAARDQDDGLALALEAAGTARLAGDPAAAAALLEEALARPPAAGAARAGALERLGCFLWEAGRTTQSLAAYAAAADALGSDVTAVHAQVWGAQARAALIMAEFDEAVRLADRAVEAARQHGTAAVLSDALTTRGTAGALLGDASALDVLREGVALARDVEDRGVLCRGYANLMVAYEVSGLPAEACAAGLEGLRLLPEYGLELAVGAALACNAANMLIRRGHYARCEEVLAGLLDGRVVQGQGLHLHLERAELQLRMGNPAGARASLDGGRPAAGRRRARSRRRARHGHRGAAGPGGRPRRLLPDRRRGAAPAGEHPGPPLPHRSWSSSGCATRPTGPARSGPPRSRDRRRGSTGWPPNSTA